MSFENCKNCGGSISCGCEYQVAKDGTECCDACIQNYNRRLLLSAEQANLVSSLEIKKEKKINKNNVEQHTNEISLGTSDENNNEEPKIL